MNDQPSSGIFVSAVIVTILVITFMPWGAAALMNWVIGTATLEITLRQTFWVALNTIVFLLFLRSMIPDDLQ